MLPPSCLPKRRTGRKQVHRKRVGCPYRTTCLRTCFQERTICGRWVLRTAQCLQRKSHLSVYERTEGILLRKAEDSLVGMGTDLRGRALLESVIKSINQRQHFLDTEEDLEREYLCLNQYVDQWIDKLEKAGPTRPVHINNIKFSQLPNTYDAVVLKDDIDKHTRSIVDDIIREITNFVNKINIPAGKLKGVVFLGNTFTNEQFIRAIKERYALPDKNYYFL